jgi:preprotein translocase subunit SecA
MTVRVQSTAQLDEAAEAMESRGENLANITYTAPTETGEVEVRVDEESQHRQAAGVLSAGAAAFARVGRNDACPCGSGKKFKHCHGKLT